MFKRTTAINKILKLKKRVKGIQGGTSAGKTFGILPVLINKAIQTPNLEISVVAESIPHLKRGALKDFKKILLLTNRWYDNYYNKTDSRYTFPNGSYIEFFSADNDAKLRGARRDILYMNECNNMTFHAYTELASRTKLDVYLDWNPTASFWFHHELQNDNDVDFIILTYKDNEACPKSAIDFINKAKEKSKKSNFWSNWYKVYGLGQIGSLDGVIFDNWTTIDTLPKDARYLGSGLDFGYTNDPTTLVDCYRYNGKLIIDEVIYRTGLLNNDISRIIKDTDINRCVYADAAEPKSIDEIKQNRVIIKAAAKGKDSIKFGISLLHEHDIEITKRSVNLIKEFRNYVWAKDRDGNKTNKPIDAFNHGIDAVRYFAVEVLKNKDMAPDIHIF